jgi:hypothetical protein
LSYERGLQREANSGVNGAEVSGILDMLYPTNLLVVLFPKELLQGFL